MLATLTTKQFKQDIAHHWLQSAFVTKGNKVLFDNRTFTLIASIPVEQVSRTHRVTPVDLWEWAEPLLQEAEDRQVDGNTIRFAVVTGDKYLHILQDTPPKADKRYVYDYAPNTRPVLYGRLYDRDVIDLSIGVAELIRYRDGERDSFSIVPAEIIGAIPYDLTCE